MNVIVLTGRLTKEIELKFSQSGKAYARFSLAVENPFKKDEADFINCASFGKTAELIAEYVRKGQKIGVQGRLQMNRYEKDGEKRTSYDVIVSTVEFLTPKSSNDASNNTQVQKSQHNEVTPDDDEEFPF